MKKKYMETKKNMAGWDRPKGGRGITQHDDLGSRKDGTELDRVTWRRTQKQLPLRASRASARQ